MLQANHPAPSFSSPNQHGETVSLTDFAGKQHVVLYFYPKDDTPGCTLKRTNSPHWQPNLPRTMPW